MSLLIKSVVFTLLLPGTVAFLIPLEIINGELLDESWSLFFGGSLMLSGVTLYCWCVWDFISFGKGTPAPIDAPKYLVVRGLYNYTRNPMYIAVLTVILAWFVLSLNITVLLYGVLVGSCFQVMIIFYEEPILRDVFQADYLSYENKVNRWIPNLKLEG